MNPPSIEDQVVDFYNALFDQIFSDSFGLRIDQRVKRNAMVRQVQESADAASQSLTRFFTNRQLTEQQVLEILRGLTNLGDLLDTSSISNPNVMPERLVDELLPNLPCPDAVGRTGHDAVYRVALHSIVQVLMLVGPVMAEWQKLSFSSTFELVRRVVNRLNQISEQMDALGRSGQAAADERYELSYRDYLLQRFHQVEAGTVRMTTNLAVDLRELFVMPRVAVRRMPGMAEHRVEDEHPGLMDLDAARQFFRSSKKHTAAAEQTDEEDDRRTTALEQVTRYPRSVLVGAPGVGKSTFLEWLQLQLASVEVQLVLAGRQAIPLLLRVRELTPCALPRDATLIEKATGSKDRAALMPPGWIHRQMKAGRVLLMLDGLDETEPDLCELHLLPWLYNLCREFPNCRYLVSSRPVGYAPDTLRALEFAECDLLDFEEPQILEYTRHWCTGVRLVRNEPEDEARREGTADGDRIVDGFGDHPYIRDLARNPLMLSAICLVNYFEGGQLPDDRALLYRLCVEGLLHNWDQRRGIHADFTFDDKLRTCREVALAMQADDRAEYEGDKVQETFTWVLGEPARAERLLEHIRYRTGLLLERRPNVFAFAHLTFQEYLAARAVHEGNRFGVDADRLARDHDDDRWQEVIPLYCGLAPAPAARDAIVRLIAQPSTRSLSAILTEAYLASGPELAEDADLRHQVMERVAICSTIGTGANLERFSVEEAVLAANELVGTTQNLPGVSEAFAFLRDRGQSVDWATLTKRFGTRQTMEPNQLCELVYLLHRYGSDRLLAETAASSEVYEPKGPTFPHSYKGARVRPVAEEYDSQAEVALIALAARPVPTVQKSCSGFFAALLKVLSVVLRTGEVGPRVPLSMDKIASALVELNLHPQNRAVPLELASLARLLAERTAAQVPSTATSLRLGEAYIAVINRWADLLVSDGEQGQPQATSGADIV